MVNRESDGLLPPWDANPDEPVRDRRPAVPGGTFGVNVKSVSEVTRAVRDASAPTTGCATCGSRARSGGSRSRPPGHAYFTLKDERSQLSVHLVPRRPADLAVRAPDRAAGRRPRPDRRLRPAGRLPALRRVAVQPAGFGDLALRFEELKARLAAEGLFDAGRKRPLPVRPPVIAVATSATGAVWHDIRNVLAAALAAGPGRPRDVPGPGRAGAGQHRCRARPDRPLRRPVRGGGPPGRRARSSRSWPAAADRSRTSGRSTTSGSSGRSSPTRCPWCAASATRPTSPWPTSRPTSGRRRRRRPRSSSCPTGSELAALLARRVPAPDAGDRRARGGPPRARRPSAGPLDGLGPAERLAQARERAGCPPRPGDPDGARPSAGARAAEERAEPPARRSRRPASGWPRPRSTPGVAALAVLGPQATLDRGYAIVRRRADGADPCRSGPRGSGRSGIGDRGIRVDLAGR